MIAIAAVHSNCDTIEDIAHWGQDWFRQFPVLTNRVASEKALLCILRALDPTQFEGAFRRWMAGVVSTLKGGQSIDDRAVPRSGSGGESTSQVVSAFATQLDAVLGEERAASKSKETTAIPELLKPPHIHGLLVAIHALGCQQNIARAITNQRSDRLLAVNGNKPARLDVIETDFCDQSESEELDRHRHVHPHCSPLVAQIASALPVEAIVDPADWPKCKKMALIDSLRKVAAHESKFERRDCTSFRDLTAEPLVTAVQTHWGDENRLHCALDVTLGEDARIMRKDNAPRNVSLLKEIVLNLIRLDIADETKISVQLKRKPLSWKGDAGIRILAFTGH